MRQLRLTARYLIIVVLLALAAGRGYANLTRATAGTAANATVVVPLDINKLADLQFGRAFFSANAHTITVAPDDSRTASDNTILGEGDPVSAATFLLVGEPNSGFHIYTPGPIALRNPDTQMTITVDSFTFNTSTSHSRLGSNGRFTVTMGATAHIKAAQPSGWYTASFTFSIHYE